MSHTNPTQKPVAQGQRKQTHVTFIFSLILHGRQIKLSWVHSTAIGGVTPALATPMHYDLRGEISPPFLAVFTPNELYVFVCVVTI